MARSSAEFYEWLIRVTNLIRDQQEPHDRELFELFARELGQVLSFDTLSKFDATSATFHWSAGPELKKIYAEKVEQKTAESHRLAVWVYAHQETIVLGSLDKETRFSTIPCMRQAGLQSVCRKWSSTFGFSSGFPRRPFPGASQDCLGLLSRGAANIAFCRASARCDGSGSLSHRHRTHRPLAPIDRPRLAQKRRLSGKRAVCTKNRRGGLETR
jgi:hypothetical protein